MNLLDGSTAGHKYDWVVEHQARKLPRWCMLACDATYQEVNASFDAFEALGEDVVRLFPLFPIY